MGQINKVDKGPEVHCNVFDYCAVHKMEKKCCWEVARSMCDFHYVFNVCSDCIVYLYEHDNVGLSKRDIEQILKKRLPVQEH